MAVAKKEPNVMPEEALKRFAEDLTSNKTGERFLEQNLQRVDDFINKPPTVDLDLDRRVVDDYIEEKGETDHTLQKRREKQEARAKAIAAGEIKVEDPREKRLKEQKEVKTILSIMDYGRLNVQSIKEL